MVCIGLRRLEALPLCRRVSVSPCRRVAALRCSLVAERRVAAWKGAGVAWKATLLRVHFPIHNSPFTVLSEMPTVFTIGHGRQPFDQFVALLRMHDVQMVLDVRSSPRSRWPWFNGASLQLSLPRLGIGYEQLPELGGKIRAEPPDFEWGLKRVMELASEMAVALLCSESQPLTSHVRARANCHRVGLLSPPLKKLGARILHILPDGRTMEMDESSIESEW